MLIIVRHAHAVPRARWDGDDRHRPLTASGTRQAETLVTILHGVSIDAIVSSPTTRCKATVRPLALDRQLAVKTSSALRQGRRSAALDLALDVVGDVLLCTHGDPLVHVLHGLRRLGWPIPARPRNAKGSTWLLSRERCDYVPPAA